MDTGNTQNTKADVNSPDMFSTSCCGTDNTQASLRENEERKIIREGHTVEEKDKLN